jgi:hypothetical protein
MDGLLDATSRSDAGPEKKTTLGSLARLVTKAASSADKKISGTRRPVIGSDLIF